MKKLLSTWIALNLLFALSLNATTPVDTLLQRAQRALHAADLPTALQLSQDALQTFTDTLQLDSLLAESYHWIGASHYYLGEFTPCIHHWKQALRIRQALYGPDAPLVGRTLNNLGIVNNSKGDYPTALQYFHQALRIFEAQEDPYSPLLSIGYTNLAVLYTEQGDYATALDYFKRVLAIDEHNLPEGDLEIATDYNNIGACLEDMGKYNEALNYHKKALLIRKEKLGKEHTAVADVYGNIGICYKSKGDYGKALKYYKLEMKIQEKNEQKNKYELIRRLNNIGECYGLKGDLSLALESYNYVIKLYNEYYPNDRINKSFILRNISNLYIDRLNWKKAAEYISSAEKELDKLENVKKGISYKYEYLQLLGNKLIVLLSNNNYDQVKYKVRLLSNNVLKLFEEVYYKFEHIDSKKKLLDQMLDVFDLVLKKQLLASRQKEDIESAYYYVEITKSLRQKEYLRLLKAERFGSVPLELLEQIKKLKLDISGYEKEIHRPVEGTIADRQELEKNLFQLKREYSILLKEVELNYPRYYNLRYDLSFPDLISIQESVSLNQTIIEFYVGKRNSFVFLINKESIEVFPLNLNKLLESKIYQLRKSIEEYPIRLYKGQLDDSNWEQLSFELYEQLLAPFYPNLKERLIIIPDSDLWYLPFEILLTEIPQKYKRYKEYPYLIMKHDIIYAYSAGTLLESINLDLPVPNNQALIVAPNFEGSAFPVLHHQGEECDLVRSIFRGKSLTGSNAQVDTFCKQARDYGIIHLATHAKADERNGGFSYLVFDQNSDGENEFLFTKDIYNLELNTNLITLSACETGKGKLETGEGLVSLSRAFTFAGARSVLASLWSVDDKSTNILMQDFYKAIKDNRTKDNALAQAKRNYITQVKTIKAHPFFWSAFVLNGSSNRMEIFNFNTITEYKFYIVLILLSIALLIFFFKSYLINSFRYS